MQGTDNVYENMMARIERAQPGLGTGIYTYADAARLLSVTTRRLRRWVDGYIYAANGQERRQGPILQRRNADDEVLTFYDLVELRFVKEFLDLGVPLPSIRLAAQHLADDLDTAYPFASAKLQTDGAQLLRRCGDALIDPATCQRVFEFATEFFKQLTFDPGTMLAETWHPLGLDVPVVIDRRRSFGMPIVESGGVRTDVLYATYKAEDDDVNAVSEWYDVSPEAVKAAVRFEEQWQQKKAA